MEHFGSAKGEHLDETAVTILENLGLTWGDLEGKKVLDIGSGEAAVARAAKKKGIDVISYDLEPHLSLASDLAQEHAEKNELDITEVNPRQFIENARRYHFDVPYVRGDAARLPFADCTFDLIISHAAPPSVWTETRAEGARILHEVRRVLKAGGEYRQSPGMSQMFPHAGNLTELRQSIQAFVQEHLPGTKRDRNRGYYRFVKPIS